MLHTYFEGVIRNLEKLKDIDSSKISLLVDEITSSKNKKSKIFVYGIGRSGYVAKAFTMRLMHLGFNVYFVGEPNSPSMEDGDILIIISGSGNTYSVVNMLKRVKELKNSGNDFKIISIGCSRNSEVERLSDIYIHIKTHNEEYFPMGTLFEELAFIFLDGIIYLLMKRLGITEEEMKKRHCNLL
ncbi:MAG TPA: SIS domain-containing protein [Methanothermococcus okinawensis]|uniref:SIS domain-containing protein n=1 Tax=Methanothermococcus okinawensis TaxID=155863 RepID=A0A833DPS5_9EURY|nr:SIS domain-containing protein [Methanothermococcus okinawensis]